MTRFGGAHLSAHVSLPEDADAAMPEPDLVEGPKLARLIAELIQRGLIVSAHDASEGGPLVAVAEMLIAGSSSNNSIGAKYTFCGPTPFVRHLGDRPHCYVLEIEAGNKEAVSDLCTKRDCKGVTWLGEFTGSGSLSFESDSIPVADLIRAWNREII
ncbi:MAG: hypothetical protein H6808_12110 [Phycisphaera sp.]|nr:hypothetical protein [Phycisphaera sp.]